MSAVQLPDSNPVIDMTYKLPLLYHLQPVDHMSASKLWGTPVIKGQRCFPLWPEFSQRSGCSPLAGSSLHTRHLCRHCINVDEWLNRNSAILLVRCHALKDLTWAPAVLYIADPLFQMHAFSDFLKSVLATVLDRLLNYYQNLTYPWINYMNHHYNHDYVSLAQHRLCWDVSFLMQGCALVLCCRFLWWNVI